MNQTWHWEAFPAVAVPTIMTPPQFVKTSVTVFFLEHENHYRRIWERLGDVQYIWSLSNYDERVALLKLSSINSILSIQASVERHELAFEMLLNGATIYEALSESGLNYWEQKFDWIVINFSKDRLWDEAVDGLNAGLIDIVQRHFIDEAKGLGTAKSPFTLANLGFVQKMCLDANVSNLVFEGGETPGTDVVDTYEGLCADVRDLFEDLYETANLAPYELQWLLFDFNRLHIIDHDEEHIRRNNEEIAKHDIWFNTVVGTSPHRLLSVVRRLTEDAKSTDPDDLHKDYWSDEDKANLGGGVEGRIDAAIHDAIGGG